jgi:hypothetical protein
MILFITSAIVLFVTAILAVITYLDEQAFNKAVNDFKLFEERNY